MRHTFIIATSLGSAAAFMDGTEQPTAGTGAPGDMPKVSLDGSATGAVCLDGSDPAYYIRAGSGSGANKYYIHHEGGGWCEGYPDCVSRSKTNLGSSKAYPATINQNSGYFSTDPKTNPLMYNWNMVYMKYCDGASFSGNNATVNVDPATGTPLHFRGSRVRAAMQESLFAKGLAKATDLVVSGCSAGGLATFLHTDQWCDALKAVSPGAKCVGMPDSGFFLDFQDPRAMPTAGEGATLGTTHPGNYHDGLKWVFELQNATSGVSADCIAAFPEAEQYRCIFAQHSAVHQRSPFFPLQSKYDAWQTGHVLFNGSDTASVNTLGRNITELLLRLSKVNKGWGGFIDACHHHCGAWDSIRIDNDLVGDALAKWYAGVDDPTAKKVWNQDETYPCEACCKP